MIDLHIHLDGSLPLELLPKLAKLANYELPSNYLDLVQVPLECKSLNEYLNCFAIPVDLLQTPEAITLAINTLVHKLASEGLIYTEIRFAPLLHLKQGLTQDQVVEAAIAGLDDTVLPAQLILCCMRGFDASINVETVNVAKKYLKKGVCAVDLAGAEALFKTHEFADVFAHAQELKVPFTIHAGEADDYTSVDDAIHFGAQRIGHGIKAIGSHSTMQEIVDHKITLEMCPTSNYQTKAINAWCDYPLQAYLVLGVKATINTDNVTVSSTSLKQEYNLIREKMRISKAEIYQLLLNAIAGAFLSDLQKEKLHKQLDHNFADWYANLAQ